MLLIMYALDILRAHHTNFSKIRMENRIKVVLVDKKRTNKWLAEQLGCSPTTVSKWCTNVSQPPMDTFVKIAELLEVNISELLRFEKKNEVESNS